MKKSKIPIKKKKKVIKKVLKKKKVVKKVLKKKKVIKKSVKKKKSAIKRKVEVKKTVKKFVAPKMPQQLQQYFFLSYYAYLIDNIFYCDLLIEYFFLTLKNRLGAYLFLSNLKKGF